MKKKRVGRSREWEEEGGEEEVGSIWSWEKQEVGCPSRVEDQTATWIVPYQNTTPFLQQKSFLIWTDR
jgi:hypothetical protein